MKKFILLLLILIFVFTAKGTFAAENPGQVPVDGEDDYAALQRKYDDSIKRYQKILEADPYNESAYLKLAELYRFRGMIDEAIGAYESAAHINPNNSMIYYRLGECYSKQQAGDSHEAIQAFQKAIDLANGTQPADFDVAQVNFLIGEAYAQEYELDQAVPYLIKAMDIDPSLAEVRYQLGWVYFEQGKRELAKGSFEGELAMNPLHEDSLYYLGVINNTENKPDAAIEYFKKITFINPRNENAYSWLGYLYAQKKQFDTAEHFYLKAIELNSDDSMYALAYIYHEQKKYDEAISLLESGSRQEVEESKYRELLAQCYLAKKDFKKAKEILEQMNLPSRTKVVVFFILMFVPMIVVHFFGKRLLNNLPDQDGEDKIVKFHRFGQLTQGIILCSCALLGIVYVVMGLGYFGTLYGVTYFPVYVLGLTWLVISLSVRAAYFPIDKAVRKTTAKFSEYFWISIGKYLFFALELGVVFLVFPPIYKLEESFYRTIMIMLALAVCIYGFSLLSPCLVRIIYRCRRLTDAEGRERLVHLCRESGVHCQDIMVIETNRLKLAIGYASGIWKSNQFIFLSSYLLEQFTKLEVESVFLHELGHLKYQHFRTRVHLTFILGVLLCLSSYLPDHPFSNYDVIILIIVYFYVIRIIARRQEKAADEFAVQHADSPESMISALEKVYTVNYIPKKWKAPNHPSLENRIKYIRERMRPSPQE